MYINSPLGELGKTPKWLKKLDKGVRDTGKKIDRGVRRAGEDISKQHHRNLKNIGLTNKTPKFIKKLAPAATSIYGGTAGGYIGSGAGAAQGARRLRGKGLPGSDERIKYQEDIAKIQHQTRVATGAALAVAGGTAAYGAYGAGEAAGTTGKVGAALSTAASMGDKITDMLDPFNPDSINTPSTTQNTTSSTNKINWLPIALVAGYFLL